ncbi:MAG: ligand-binding sensor domain-containing protein [Candidatus Latescibacterota bacterium]
MHIAWLIALIWVMISGAPASGSEVKWEHYGPVGYTNDVFVTDVSTAWVATQYGVIRWNTVTGEYRHFSQFNGWEGNLVFNLVADRSGQIWCRTNRGIICYDGIRWKTLTTDDGLPDDVYLSCVTLDGRGIPWFGTSKGLVRLDGATCKVFLPNAYIAWVSTDEQGNIWAQASSGFYRLNGVTYETIPITDFSESWNCRTRIITDDRGWLWIGCAKAEGTGQPSTYGLIRYNNSDWHFYPLPEGIWEFVPASGEQNTIWAKGSAGIFFFDGFQWKRYSPVDSLASREIRHATTDKNGVTWFGTTYGVTCFDETAWKRFIPDEGAVGSGVNDVAIDAKGGKWFATSRGVSIFDGKSWKTYTTEDGLAHNDVLCLTQDMQGAIWCGTRGGVSRFNGVSWETFSAEQGLAGNTIISAATDHKGNVWLGTDGGLSCFDGAQWKTMAPDKKHAGYDVRCITVVSDGAVWCGMFFGAFRYDGRTWESFTSANGNIIENVRGITEDAQGRIWIATYTKGIFRFDGSTWERYSEANNPLLTEIRCIETDARGMIWVGEYWGFFQFDGSTWEMNHAVNNIRCIAFDSDGSAWIGSDFLSHYSPSTDVEDAPPVSFQLRQNYPNPFNPSTIISFSISRPGRARITIYNIQGQEVRTIVDDFRSAGFHSVVWNGKDNNSGMVASGVFFYELMSPDGRAQRKMVLLR